MLPNDAHSGATRRALIGGAIATGIAGLVASHSPNSAAAHQASIASPMPTTMELVQPAVRSSSDGILEIDLVATPAIVDMAAAQPVTTWTYDGVVPGHTWELRPGDTLKINLQNDLPKLDHDTMSMIRPHAWSTTNIHTHGLHVSPEGNSDNVFIEVEPGEAFAYEIAIPGDHTGGMFWYHPHKHGGVCQQVRAGMAGALIVRGEVDDVPEIAAATEQVMLLQAIELGDEFQLLDPIPDPTKQQAFFPRTQILYPINGKMNPTITMYPGEVQRWRLLNAAEGKFMSLELTGHEMHEIAWDGLTLAAPTTVSGVSMSAGNRVDLLIKAGEPGTYDLLLTPGSSQHPEILAMFEGSGIDFHATPGANAELQLRSILQLIVAGEGPEMELPTVLPAWDPPMPPVTRTREFEYTVQREDDNEFISFGIDGEAFSHDRAPYQVKLDTTEEWILSNGIDHKLLQHAHGFHIHVNPFKVTQINGRTLDTPLWRDTFALTGMEADQITFEINFTDFTGKFVEHCHVLAHEDLGMMEVIEVLP